MAVFREDHDVRIVEFCDDCPEGVLAQAVSWLEQKDKDGRENAFYFLNLAIYHMEEIGWLVDLYCGKEIRTRKKRKG